MQSHIRNLESDVKGDITPGADLHYGNTNIDNTAHISTSRTRVSFAPTEDKYATRNNFNLVSENLVDLPFNNKWKFFVMISISLMYTFQLYVLFYRVVNETLNPCYYYCRILSDIILTIDIGFTILHKYVCKTIRKKRDIPPRKTYYLVLDIITLIGTDYYIYDVTSYNISAGMLLINVCRLIRVYRIFLYVSELNNAVGHHDVYIIAHKFGIIAFLGLHTLSCLYSLVQVFNPSMAEKVMKLKWVTVKTSLEQYLINTYMVLATVTSMGYGDMFSGSAAPRWLAVVMMMVGFVVLAVFVGAFTSYHVELGRHHSGFTNRMNLINRDMTQNKLPRRMKDKVKNFYYAYWQQRKGISVSTIYNALPLSMKMEIMLDTYWDALNASFLFCDLNVAHKRAISSLMSTHVYVTGDAIITQGQKNNRMMYILRGRVNILSEEDCESPIMTLSMGTCICEMSLVMNLKSSVHIRAATYCEIQVLEQRKLGRLYLKYVTLGGLVHAKYLVKMQLAKKKWDESMLKKSTAASSVYDLKSVKQMQENLAKELSRPETYTWVNEEEMTDTARILQRPKELFEMYVPSKGLKETSDDLCLRTRFPFIIQPDTTLVLAWDTCVVAFILSVGFLYPYYAAFARIYPKSFKIYLITVDLVYILDVVKEISTSIDIANEEYHTIIGIFMHKITTMKFIIDVISVIPLEYLLYWMHIYEDERLFSVLKLNRVLKVIKAYFYFTSLENSPLIKLTSVRMVKYVLMMVFGAYFLGCLLYIRACFTKYCYEDSWFTFIVVDDLRRGTEYTRYKYVFAMSLHFGMALISGSGFGNAMGVNLEEMKYMYFFFLIGELLYSYLISDYSAKLILASKNRLEYKEMVHVVQKFLENNSILPSIQERMYLYLSLQWEYREGYLIMHNESLYHDASPTLRYEINFGKRMRLISSVPLFQDLQVDIIKRICISSESYILPPNEVVQYAGTRCHGFYIIDVGFCVEISVLTDKVERILGPGIHFCAIEMLLETTSVNSVRTVTHTKIVRVPRKALLTICSEFRGLRDDLSKIVNHFKEAKAIEKLPFRDNIIFYDEVTEFQEKLSWVVFRNARGLKNFDYMYPFEVRLKHFKFLRWLLLRRTITPDGTFIFCWEAVRATCAILSGLIFPVSGYLIYDAPLLNYVCNLLDIMAIIDLYIRLHVCYYAQSGVLVSHPLLTAKHYLTHSFLVDLVAVLPLGLLMGSEAQASLNKVIRPKTSDNFWDYNRVLQLYRLPGACAYFERDVLNIYGGVNFIKYVPIAVVLLNVICSILVNMTCQLEVYPDNSYTVIRDPSSWITTYPNPINVEFNVNNMVHIQIEAYYFVTCVALSCTFGDFAAQTGKEMVFCTIIIILGYLFFTYFTVSIVSSKANLNVYLTLYQERMRHLIYFMKKNNQVSKELQTEIINYFEHVWKWTRGIKSADTFPKFHVALREDAIIQLYEATFLEMPLFQSVGRTFFRRLGMNVNEIYLLRGGKVLEENDIVNSLYIVHQGRVNVSGVRSEHTAVLERGCSFGNYNTKESMRSPVLVIAATHVSLLQIQLPLLCNLIEESTIILERMAALHADRMVFQFATTKKPAIDMALYKEDRRESTASTGTLQKIASYTKNGSWLNSIMTSGAFIFRILTIPMMLCSYISCSLIIYHLAFQDHRGVIIWTSIALEGLFIFRIYLGFNAAYEDNTGQLVTDLKRIKDRYMSSWSGFYLDLISGLPYDILCFAAPEEHRYFALSCLRTLHLLRLFHIYKFFNVKFDTLNVNMLLVKLTSVITWVSLLLHFLACSIYMVTCFQDKCRSNSWASYADPVCEEVYSCSVYLLMNLITCTSFGDLTLSTFKETIFCTILIIGAKFAISDFFGNISAMVANFSYTLVRYNYHMSILKSYLQLNQLSKPLITKVIIYTKFMWYRELGTQVPEFFKELPPYLMSAVKQEVYGKHLSENALFMDCEPDFVRQVIMCLRRYTYAPGNYIAYQGVVNGTMYFIHSGAVEVVSREGSTEHINDVLVAEDMFGLTQGIYKNVPHSHSYRAYSVAVVLSLRHVDWGKLFRYFPNSRQILYEKVADVVNV